MFLGFVILIFNIFQNAILILKILVRCIFFIVLGNGMLRLGEVCDTLAFFFFTLT